MRAQRWVIAAAFGCGSALLGCEAILGNDYEYVPGDPGGGGNTVSGSAVSAASGSASGGGGSTACAVDLDCADMNPCSIDTCNKPSGLCDHAAAPDGAAPGKPDSPTDCVDFVCKDGQELQSADNSEAPPDDMNACTKQVCVGGAVMTSFEPVDTSCGAGGLVCDGTGTCVGCNQNGDCPDVPECMIKKCLMGSCQPANQASGTSCSVGVCDGGGSCVQCLNDMNCNGAASEICDTATNTCMSSCGDMVKNGTETDVDCGGACPQNCANGKKCANGGDCQSQVCLGNFCQIPTCTDNAKNGTETDVDCGGLCPANCATGQMCATVNDCATGNCVGNLCVACNTNGLKDLSEADIDCGSACGVGKQCVTGKSCQGDADCMSMVCVAGICYAATCDNLVKDATETDVDCGGTCYKCGNGKLCTMNSDCLTNVCTGNPKKCN